MSAGQFTYLSVYQVGNGVISFVPATGTEWVFLSIYGNVNIGSTNNAAVVFHDVSGNFNATIFNFGGSANQTYSLTGKSYFDDNINIQVAYYGTSGSNYITAFITLIQVL